jgi:hypothetical protein
MASNGRVTPLLKFLMRVKTKPDAFYEKCVRRLEAQDIFREEDLAEVDLDHMISKLQSVDATAGELAFLKSAVILAKRELDNVPAPPMEHIPQVSRESRSTTNADDSPVQLNISDEDDAKQSEAPSVELIKQKYKQPTVPLRSKENVGDGTDMQKKDAYIQKRERRAATKMLVHSDIKAHRLRNHDSSSLLMRRGLILSACGICLGLWFEISLQFMGLAIVCGVACTLLQMPVFRSKLEVHDRLVGRFWTLLAILTFVSFWFSSSSNAPLKGLQEKYILQVVEESFPGALSGRAMMNMVMDTLRPYDLKPGNVIYGQSLCSDEINNEDSHISSLMSAHWGNTFPMGGIGGAPYVGKTGFAAFSHHVPDDGHVVVLFGPHIGFSPDGAPGKFLRKGHTEESAACGAAIAAYNQCMSRKKMKDDPEDIEQSWIRQGLAPHCGSIVDSCSPMVELARETYELIEKEIFKIVNTDFGGGNLVLIGGIQINMPYPFPGYFMPLHFSIRSANSAPQELMFAFD